MSLGVEAGDRVAILGLTSAEWTLADCGAQCAGAVVAPIYHTNSPEECGYVLRHSDARVVFCENAAQAAKVEQVRDSCPALEHIVLFDDGRDDVLTIDALQAARRRDNAARRSPSGLRLIEPDDVATLVYTSGTTGPPKGCMLTHENFLSTTRMYGEQLRFNETHSLYQFLPLAHVLARVAQAVALSVGARIIYWTGDPARSSTSWPRRARRISRPCRGSTRRSTASSSGDSPTGRRRSAPCSTGRSSRAPQRAAPCASGKLPSPLTDIQYRLADQLVLSKVRAVFGPALEMGMVGAAPIAPELLEFFDACGVLVLEGYGLSETCAAATINTADAVRFGTIGRPLPGTEVRIAPDGEILIRGPHVFKGYFKDPDATRPR